jgi:hypothetical protein
MTSAQVILVAVTSALVAVTAMLIVATIKRARIRDDADEPTPDESSLDEPKKDEPG